MASMPALAAGASHTLALFRFSHGVPDREKGGDQQKTENNPCTHEEPPFHPPPFHRGGGKCFLIYALAPTGRVLRSFLSGL